MNKSFESTVLKLRPQFAATDSYLYYVPVGHILCGFVWEKIRDHAHIWQFALPLYDRIDFLNLNFGERLPAPVGLMSGFGTGQQAAVEFVRRIEPYEEETRTWQDPQIFLEQFGATGAIRNPRVRRTIAWTYILAGRPAEARTHLEIVMGTAGVDNYPHFIEDIRLILGAMDSGPDEARKCLLAWETQTKRDLHITERG